MAIIHYLFCAANIEQEACWQIGCTRLAFVRSLSDIRSPRIESPLKNLSPETISLQIRPWKICFRIDSFPGHYILKQSLRLGENMLSPVEIQIRARMICFRIDSSLEGDFISTRDRPIICLANQSNSFWLYNLYLKQRRDFSGIVLSAWNASLDPQAGRRDSFLAGLTQIAT